jgi:hypothetical protein
VFTADMGEQEMMKLMGLPVTLESTKGKKVLSSP